MSLPYRFKAGGAENNQIMASINTSTHSHRTTTKQSHKPFKPRFASKGALKDIAKGTTCPRTSNSMLTDRNVGKVESHRVDRGKRRTPQQQVMSKIARRNQAKQLRVHHHEKKDNEQSIFQGKGGAPRHIAVVPLSPETNTSGAIKQLNKSVDVPDQAAIHRATMVKVDRFRRNLLYMPAKYDLITALDTCRLADWVLFVLSPEQQIGEEEDRFIRALEGQGITNVLCVVQGLNEAMPAPKRPKVITQLKSEMSRYFPTLDKLCVLDNQADCANVVRSLCTATSRGIRWRDARSWLLIEHLQWTEYPADQESTAVTMTGIVRGRALNPDRLVHLPGWGDFQIGQITELPRRSTKRGEDTMEGMVKRHVPSHDQDDLLTLAPEGMDLGEAASTVATDTHRGVLLDDHHYFSDDDSHVPPPPKKLPKGTSSYQAAWFLDDVTDSDSDIMDDEDQDADVTMEEESEYRSPQEHSRRAHATDAVTEAGPSEYPDSEMHVDRPADEEAEAIEDFRRSRKKEAEDDLDFPDEIEMHPNVLARERLAKYRGLKSLRTSEWNVEPDAPYEPSDYQRLLKISNFKKSRNAAAREALGGGVAAGTKVEVEILNVPVSLQKSRQPNSLFNLLRHEHKSTVVNLNMTLSSALSEPVRSKEELVVQIGPRRFAINPIFSAAGTTPNDVHKFDRFLHAGQTSIATFIGPLTWGSVPALVFKDASAHPEHAERDSSALFDAIATDGNPSTVKTSPQLRLIGNATTVPPSSSRVIAKRVILTGHSYKIHKKLVTVRYMFFNKEDVGWFSALPLWTKRGRQGFIKESLGTHGYFKATFDGKTNPMDAIGVSLYKRVWPRSARMWEGERGFAA
jgi:pre-rRNA-processing protein TSR1